MCLVLLGTAPRGATALELVRLVAVLASWARARGIRMSDELAADDRAALLANVDRLARERTAGRAYDEGSEVVYAIEPSRHPIASYYRNTIVHHFLDKAIIELALFKAGDVGGRATLEAAFWAETDRLRELFKFEFFYPPREEFRAGLVAELAARRSAVARAAVGRPPGYAPPRAAVAALHWPRRAAAVRRGVCGGRRPAGAARRPARRWNRERCVELALKEGRQAYLLRRISSEASIGKILFENGYRLAAHLGLAGESTTESLAGRRELLRELRALSHRMERLRVEALARAEEIMGTQA